MKQSELVVMTRLSLTAALVAFIAAFPFSSVWAAKIEARIDISSQRMVVYIDGKKAYNWKVSTGKTGYSTPVGTFRPKQLNRVHFSKKYDDAPMPHSIHFLGGYAIHGTSAVGKLGRPASRGCVRLAPGNAAKLFSLVKANKPNSRIVITR